jgi:hypothetical protein
VSFLLDTNIVSEWTKPSPNPGVIAWTDGMDEDRAFLSVVTVAELRRGVDRLPQGTRRRRFDLWLCAELATRFENRILPIDGDIADLCGQILARNETAGRHIEAMDAFIAATAVRHDLTLVTRNVSDFKLSVRSILNPWT